jgi:mRNA interferase MazF
VKTPLRGEEITAASPKFLKPGAFDVQGIVTVPTVRLMNRPGTLTADQMRAVERGICSWLGINIAA